MFDIGFGELLLVFVIGLVVLGPERLPVAVRTVAGWIRTLRSLASTVQSELAQEMKLQELQESLKKVEQAGNLQNLSPELKASMSELREAADAMQRSYTVTPEPEEAVSALPAAPLSDPEAIYDGVVDNGVVDNGIVDNGVADSAATAETVTARPPTAVPNSAKTWLPGLVISAPAPSVPAAVAPAEPAPVAAAHSHDDR